MRCDEVPQDQNSTFAGHQKLLYATDEQGRYRGVGSQGWSAETYATRLALAAYEELAAQAHARWKQGKTSPLEYLMYERRMDLMDLSRATGLWRWRIRRHFKPKNFARLSIRLFDRYADALGLSRQDLVRMQNKK